MASWDAPRLKSLTSPHPPGLRTRAISLNANYSNARYILGLVYDAKQEKSKALDQFSKIVELNPDNEEVKKIIANIEAGKAPLDGIVVGQPPVQETPPEIQNEGGK